MSENLDCQNDFYKDERHFLDTETVSAIRWCVAGRCGKAPSVSIWISGSESTWFQSWGADNIDGALQAVDRIRRAMLDIKCFVEDMRWIQSSNKCGDSSAVR